MQMGFFFDQTRCTSCFTCVVACKDWHDIPEGPASWRRVISIEEGSFPDLFVGFLTLSCFHCEKPACVDACPVDAISKREQDGIVIVNKELCLGKDRCDLCLQACPYSAPQFSIESGAKMQMCNLCIDRLELGKEPICVAACPMRALDAGPLEELKHKYGEGIQAVGFSYESELKPSVVFKPKHKVA